MNDINTLRCQNTEFRYVRPGGIPLPLS